MCSVYRVSALRSRFQMSVCSISLFALLVVCAQAQQAPTSQTTATVITCLSKQGEREVCKGDTAAGVALLHSTGDSECLLGKNWGYDDAGVWVSNGCGGEFMLGGTKEASGGSNFVGMFEPYGQLRTHFAAFNDTAEVQDNATRIGIKFSTRGKIKMFAGTEWGVNIVRSATQFNLSASGNGDFGVVTTEDNPIFTARLGYIGADFGPFGRVAMGKQNGVHYDVSSYTTDRFNVFGGQGTSTYVAGTDGGPTGTGFADRVVNYRNTLLKILEVGIQGQFRGGSDSDGVGASLQLKILPGVKVGGAYTRTNWGATTQQLVRGLGGNADYMAVGTRIDWKILELGLVYSHQHNGDLAYIPIPNAPDQVIPVAFDADGVEFYARAGGKKFGLIGGYTYQGPNVKDPLLNADFKTQYLILGAEVFLVRNAKIYTESKIDLSSVTATGDSGYSVFTIGFRYDFSWRTSHQP